MRIDILTDVTSTLETLEALEVRQFPFALANALNRTGEEVLQYSHEKLPARLRIRSGRAQRFLEALINIQRGDRATKKDLRVIVGIQSPPGKSFARRARILTKFVEGGIRRAPSGGDPFAIPESDIQGSTGVPRSLYPAHLGLALRRQIEGGTDFGQDTLHVTARRKILFRGKRRTFAIDPRFHPDASFFGVFQRRGRGRNSQLRLLWTYKQQLRTPRRLPFPDDVRKVHRERFLLNVRGQLAFALNENKQRIARAHERLARVRGTL